LAVWIILFIPVFLFAGPFWLAPFWLLLFWGYAQNSERILAILFFLVFALSYPVYQRIAYTSSATVDSEISPYIRAFVEGPSVSSIADFEDYYRTHHQDQDASILLASLYVADQQMERGVRLLQRHILDHPNDPRAYNNLGAIFFQQEEMDSALKLTQKAYSLDTTNLVYVFNVSRSYRATFNFSEATRLLEAARAVDPKLIAKLEETPPDNLVSVLPRNDLVLQRIQQKNGDLLSGFMNPFTLAALGMLVLAIVINLGGFRRRNLAKSCTKCGTAYCIRCQTNTKVSDYCTQCLHIFIKKDGVSPASRKEKMGEIGVFTRRQHLLSRISSLILPGANHLYENETFRGALILLLWFFLFVVLWFNWKFSTTYLEPPGSATVLNLICVVAMVVLYFLANFHLVKRTS
jgi:tetratricopeptide (TPR) repeat protein